MCAGGLAALAACAQRAAGALLLPLSAVGGPASPAAAAVSLAAVEALAASSERRVSAAGQESCWLPLPPAAQADLQPALQAAVGISAAVPYVAQVSNGLLQPQS